MTDLEILARAKMYLDKLADGVNPLSGEPVKDDDIVRNDRISKCLLYVSGVLTRVIENGGEVGRRRSGRAGFQIDPEKLGEIEFSDFPVGVSVLCDRISVCKADENMKRLSHVVITEWLVEKGFLQVFEIGEGRTVKRPTSAGKEIGISLEERNGIRGPYEAVLYNSDAQHFIVDHLEAILNGET